MNDDQIILSVGVGVFLLIMISMELSTIASKLKQILDFLEFESEKRNAQ